MNKCMRMSCSFGLPCVSFVKAYHFVCVVCACLSWALVKFCTCASFSFGIKGGMWDVIVLIPDHCLSIYFPCWFGGGMWDSIAPLPTVLLYSVVYIIMIENL